MDEATIKQMMQEYKQAIDKAVFLRQQIANAVVQLGKTVEYDNMIAKFVPETDVFPADAFLDYK